MEYLGRLEGCQSVTAVHSAVLFPPGLTNYEQDTNLTERLFFDMVLIASY